MSVLTGFDPQTVLARPMFQRITDVRLEDSETSFRSAQNRKKREKLTIDGRLCILACDHPARRVVNVGDNTLAMADRYDYIARIVAVLQAGTVDGVMATMDVLEELLILHELFTNIGKPGLLDDKLLIPSLNRGGLAGTVWEMDDPMTGPGVETCKLWGMDGVKMLMRLADDNADSIKTLQYCAEQITYANELELPIFLKPQPVQKEGNQYKVVKTPEALAKIAGVAVGMGDSSRNLWLKLPYCENFKTVAAATTSPILLLGGEATGDDGFVENLKTAMQTAWNVRGVMIGRNALYPASGDPVAATKQIFEIVHAPKD